MSEATKSPSSVKQAAHDDAFAKDPTGSGLYFTRRDAFEAGAKWALEQAMMAIDERGDDPTGINREVVESLKGGH